MQTKKFVSKFFDYTPFLLGYVFAFVLVGGAEFFSLTYGEKDIPWGLFFINLVIMYGATLVVLTNSITLAQEKEIRENALYQELYDRVRALTLQVKPNITEFIYHLNRDRKLQALTYQITKQIEKLDSKRTEDDLIAYINKDETNVYVQNREALISRLEKKVIEREIDYTTVYHNPITESFIKAGRTRNTDIFEYYIEGDSRTKAKHLGVRYVFNLGFSFLLVGIGAKYLGWEQTALYTVGLRIFILIYNWGYGRYYGKKFVETKQTQDLQYRQDLLVRYTEWDNIERSEV